MEKDGAWYISSSLTERYILALLLGALQLFFIHGISLVEASRVSNEKHFALVIGNNSGTKKQAPLLYAQTDAKRVAQLLREIGGYKKHQVKLLLSPSVKQVRAELAKVKKFFGSSSKKAGSFLFYYSGHAIYKKFQFGEKRMPFSEIVRFIRGLPVKLRFVLVDSCFSGSMIGTKGTRPKGFTFTPPPKPSLQGRFPKKLKGFAIFTSSGKYEKSYESKRLEGSFFTSSLLAGLRGAADRDQDKRISLTELRGYVYQKTVKYAQEHRTPAQRPSSSITIEGGQNVYLTDIKKAEAHISVGKKLRGHFFLFRNGRLEYEFTKTSLQAMTVAIRSGEYQIQIHRNTWLARIDKKIATKSIYTLNYDKLGWKKLSKNQRGKGGGPFIPDYSTEDGGTDFILTDGPDASFISGLGVLGMYAPFDHLSTHSVGLALQLDILQWAQIGGFYRFSLGSPGLHPYRTQDLGLKLAFGYGFNIGRLRLWGGVMLAPHLVIRQHTELPESVSNIGFLFGAQVNGDLYITRRLALRLSFSGGGDLVLFRASTVIRSYLDTSIGLLYRF